LETKKLINLQNQSEALIKSAGDFAMEKLGEVHASMLLAMQFRRQSEVVAAEIISACKYKNFAESAIYVYPRGNTKITGLGIVFAREAAMIYGNLRYGMEIVEDSEDIRTIRGWCWDIQSNTKVHQDDIFAKLIQRRGEGGTTTWVKPDERDLRELTNRRGSIAIRNCILSILPSALKDECMDTIIQTRRKSIGDDPKKVIRSLVIAFSDEGVMVDKLEEWSGCEIEKMTEDQVIDLRGIFQSIADGNTFPWDHFGKQNKKTKLLKLDKDKMNPVKETKPDFDEKSDNATDKKSAKKSNKGPKEDLNGEPEPGTFFDGEGNPKKK